MADSTCYKGDNFSNLVLASPRELAHSQNVATYEKDKYFSFTVISHGVVFIHVKVTSTF